MVAALILIPALIALGLIHTRSAARVAQLVYIPCLMIVPAYLEFRVGGLNMNVTSLVSLLVGSIGIVAAYRTLKFSAMDACVVAYTISAYLADAHTHEFKVALYAFLWSLSKCIFPYLIGRTLIEQTGSRVDFAKTLVVCLAVIGVVSMWEFRMETNLFQTFVDRVTHTTSWWGRQVRWGFGRIAGPYGHAITAGMIFSAGLLLQLWLVGTKSWTVKAGQVKNSKRSLWLTLAVTAGLLMTQSRGPWIGFAFGLIVASIGFARNRKRAAILSLTAMVVGLAVTSVILDKYTDAKSAKKGDIDQQNAEYRRNLYDSYKPLIDKGGLLGWGTPSLLPGGIYAWAPNQPSIDNEYLRIAMLQGYLGAFIFVSMFALGYKRLITLCITMRAREDILFAYCMLGALIAMSFTLTTVFLADPMMQIVFLFLGWVQSMAPSRTQDALPAAVAAPPFVFERVFV